MVSAPTPPASHAPEILCPRCGADGGLLSLLTSMTRYYACARCTGRWQISRDWELITADLQRVRR